MRLRILFSKSGGLRYTGHLDLHSTWERTVRRAGLPLAYTQGFHPGPRLQIASALPLGFIGRAEIVDVWLDETRLEAGPWDFRKALQSGAPPGLDILSAEQVDEHSPALQTQVAAAEYLVTLLDPVDPAGLANAIAGLLAAASLPREWRKKTYDLRPLIETLSPDPTIPPRQDGSGLVIHMQLAAREGATGRPDEVLSALGIPPEAARVERLRLILKDG